MATNRVQFFMCRMNFDLIMYERLIFPPSPLVQFFERLPIVDLFKLTQSFKLMFTDGSCVPNDMVTKLRREYLSGITQVVVIPTMNHTSSDAQIFTSSCQAIPNIKSVQFYKRADDVVLLLCKLMIHFHDNQLWNKSSKLSSLS